MDLERLLAMIERVPKRWLGFALVAGSISHCSLVTDFSGVADGPLDGGAGSAGSGGAAAGPSFPRLAAYETSNPKDFDDPAHQTIVARLDLSIMGVYPGWEDGHGPVEQVVKNVKALNPSTRLFVLVQAASFEGVAAGNAYETVIDTLNDNQWWLYESGTTSIVPAPYPDQFATNTTLFTPEDASGFSFIEWFARWAVDTYHVPNPTLDGVLVDDDPVFPLVSGDYDRDGTTDDDGDPQSAAWHREGYRRLFDDLRALAPDKLLLADLKSFGHSNAVTTELEGVLHGGLLLDLIGQSFSPESSSWNAMMAEYRKAMASVIEPRLVVFHVSVPAGDYAALRYGLASCLMDDGYFATDDPSASWGIEWFDEFDVDLGAPTSPPPEVPWSNGVYRRDFEHGLALVNPRGNAAATVEIEPGYVRIQGEQDPTVNDGQPATSVTLNERDGLILLREAAR
jgi:hypothetical protein